MILVTLTLRIGPTYSARAITLVTEQSPQALFVTFISKDFNCITLAFKYADLLFPHSMKEKSTY